MEQVAEAVDPAAIRGDIDEDTFGAMSLGAGAARRVGPDCHPSRRRGVQAASL
jgi:hypothetical protein